MTTAAAAGAAPVPFQSACGRVVATPPSDGKPYWRLEYRDIDGRRKQPSGGRTDDSVRAKMALIVARLDADLEDGAGQVPGNDLLNDYLRPETTRRRGRVWSEGTREGHVPYFKKYVRPVLGEVDAERWRGAHYRRIVSKAPTRKEGEQVRRRLSGFLNWCHSEGHLSDAQLVAFRNVRWKAPEGYQERPERTERVLESGEDEGYLPAEDAMDADTLRRVARALGCTYAHGELMAEMAAATGMRQGELFGLSADLVNVSRRRVRIKWQWNSKVNKLTLPKGGKRRTSVWVDGPTITGYDLSEALTQRLAEIKVEQAQGRNPHGLLFPAPRGGYLNASNFDSRCWSPAMAKAEIAFVEFDDSDGRTRRLYKFTTHSLRDRFAISALNVWGFTLDELQVVGGWQTAQVIFARYYGVAAGVLDRLTDKTGRRPTAK